MRHRRGAVLGSVLLAGTALPASAQGRYAADGVPDSVGLRVSASIPSSTRVNQKVVLHVRVQDGNAGDYTVTVHYGDGDGEGSGASVECVAPVDVAPMDRVFDFPHKYRRGGRMRVTVEVRTRECWTSLTGLGEEHATAITSVTVKG